MKRVFSLPLAAFVILLSSTSCFSLLDTDSHLHFTAGSSVPPRANEASRPAGLLARAPNGTILEPFAGGNRTVVGGA